MWLVTFHHCCRVSLRCHRLLFLFGLISPSSSMTYRVPLIKLKERSRRVVCRSLTKGAATGFSFSNHDNDLLQQQLLMGIVVFSDRNTWWETKWSSEDKRVWRWIHSSAFVFSHIQKIRTKSQLGIYTKDQYFLVPAPNWVSTRVRFWTNGTVDSVSERLPNCNDYKLTTNLVTWCHRNENLVPLLRRCSL